MSATQVRTKLSPRTMQRQSTTTRQGWNRAFVVVCVISSFLSVVILVLLLSTITWQGAGTINGRFLSSPNSISAAKAGVYPALMGSLFVCVGCALFSLPIGVGTAIYLEEFRPRNRVLRWFRSFVNLNISNLAGVPSVVYGILGLTAFVQMFGVFGSAASPALEIGVQHYRLYATDNPKRFVRIPLASPTDKPPELKTGLIAYRVGSERVELNVIADDAPRVTDRELAGRTVRASAKSAVVKSQRWYYLRLPLDVSVLAGSLTLMLVVLPVVIISSQEALRAVPSSMRDGALGLGATPWQAVWNVTLPSAIPGIMTGMILAMSRAIGEAAPILIISGIVFIKAPPSHLFDKFSVMPLQIYNWAQQPANQGFHSLAAGGIVVLLVMLLAFNGLAVFIRHRLQKPLG